MRYAEPIERLVKALSRLPGIGEKTATRLALYILNSSREYVDELAKDLLEVKGKVKLCSGCMGFTEKDPCRICGDFRRDPATICVVSDFKDMMAIEEAGGYPGRYHVLHGSLAPLKGIGPDELRIKELIGRVERDEIKEVVLATGFDAEGETTSTYLAKLLRPYGMRLTRLASGVPVGSYIEYMDGATLGRAMDGRREIP